MKGGGSIAKTEQIHFRTRPELKQKIEMAARESGESLSEYCERVLAAASGYRKPGTQELAKEQRDHTDRKGKTIAFRVSEKDKQAIEKNAELAKLSVGEYLIRAGLDDSIVIVLDGKEIVHHLSKIGTNLNQLTILVHQGRVTCPDIEGVNQTLKKVLRLLAQAMKGR